MASKTSFFTDVKAGTVDWQLARSGEREIVDIPFTENLLAAMLRV